MSQPRTYIPSALPTEAGPQMTQQQNPQMASANPQLMAAQPFQQGVQQYPQQMATQTFQVVQQGVQQPIQRPVYYTSTPIPVLGPGASPVDCPACGSRAITKIEYVTSCYTHLWALTACVVVCLPCVPYFFDSAKDVDHRCGNCGVLLATYKRSGGTVVHMHG